MRGRGHGRILREPFFQRGACSQAIAPSYEVKACISTPLLSAHSAKKAAWSKRSFGQRIAVLPANVFGCRSRLVRQWPYVRSYVVKDGHRFLSLMADGGIYEFEPAQGAK